MWTVRISHWKNGSGYTHTEDFENLETMTTAEEWFRSFQENSTTPFTTETVGDGINIEIWNYTIKVSEFFVDKEFFQ